MNVCDMAVVLRKNNTAGNSKNPWLADSVSIVVPTSAYEITSQPAPICQMAVNTPIGENAITGYSYQWNPSTYLSAANTTPTNFTYDYLSSPLPDGDTLQYLVTITRPNGCTSVDTVFVPLKGIPSVKDINDTALCHNLPLHIDFTDDTNNNPLTTTTFTWTVVNGASLGFLSAGATDYIDVAHLTNPGASPITATVTVIPTKNGCTGVSKSFKVKVRPQSLYNYPDLRIRACSEGAGVVNLSKYIDTLDLTELKWSSPIDANGNIAKSYIDKSNVHSFTYTASNPCVTDMQRKIYLESLKPNRMRPLRDTILICYEKADAMQMNQIFGVDANGNWEYYAVKPNDPQHINIDAYVTKSPTSSPYAGAVVMNGKAIYNDSAIAAYPYHGISSAKQVVFIYTPQDACLQGKSFKIVIVLTPNIIN
jgi:hypothetical protein